MAAGSSSLRSDLSRFLAQASAGYLETGFMLFHHTQPEAHGRLQAAIGNLAVGTDLAIKAFAVRVNPSLIFKDLPIEARAWLSNEEAATHFNSRPIALDLRDFAFEPVGLEDTVRILYVFFPAQKQRLRPYFQQLAELKSLSLQAALGPVKPEEALRVAYLALLVSDLLAKTIEGYQPLEPDRVFGRRFEAERANRVRARLAAAQEKAKTLKVDIAFNEPPPPDGWDAMEVRCPICKNWALVSGSTEIRCEKPSDKEEEYLDFFADSLDCDACGLRLEDVEELRAAQVSVAYDRSEDLPKWHSDKHV